MERLNKYFDLEKWTDDELVEDWHRLFDAFIKVTNEINKRSESGE